MKWICKVCGYVHEGPEPPEICPVCKVGKERFERLPDAWENAQEHQVGIAQGEGGPLVEALRASFEQACRQGGYCLAVARMADREGYAEIGGALTRLAHEQGQLAARLAEMLGDGLDATTRESLSLRLKAAQAEAEGLQGLIDQAEGQQPIREALGELARDAARHGRAIEGLLRRYFNA